jgi:ABC-type Fe3+ transport system permease subunit
MAGQLSAKTLAILVVLLLLSTVFSVINIYFVRKSKNDRSLLLGNRDPSNIEELGRDSSMWAYGMNILSILLVLGVVGVLLYNFYAKPGTARNTVKDIQKKIQLMRKKTNMD